MTVNEAIRVLMDIEQRGHGFVELAQLGEVDGMFYFTYGLSFEIIEIPQEDEEALDKLCVLLPPENLEDNPGKRFRLEVIDGGQ